MNDSEAPASVLPESLAAIQRDFLELDKQDRLVMLLEFANDLPPLPPRYLDHPELLEQVVECQSPVFIFVEVSAATEVHLFATAPLQSPTTRGFASILASGLTGLTATEVLNVPDDFANTIGLTEAVSALRLRGMTAMLARTKRQIREKFTL